MSLLNSYLHSYEIFETAHVFSIKEISGLCGSIFFFEKPKSICSAVKRGRLEFSHMLRIDLVEKL